MPPRWGWSHLSVLTQGLRPGLLHAAPLGLDSFCYPTQGLRPGLLHAAPAGLISSFCSYSGITPWAITCPLGLSLALIAVIAGNIVFPPFAKSGRKGGPPSGITCRPSGARFVLLPCPGLTPWAITRRPAGAEHRRRSRNRRNIVFPPFAKSGRKGGPPGPGLLHAAPLGLDSFCYPTQGLRPGLLHAAPLGLSLTRSA